MKWAIAFLSLFLTLEILPSCHTVAPAVDSKHQLALGLVTGAVAPLPDDITVTHKTIQLVLVDLPTFSYFIMLGVYLTVLIIVRTRNRATVHE